MLSAPATKKLMEADDVIELEQYVFPSSFVCISGTVITWKPSANELEMQLSLVASDETPSCNMASDQNTAQLEIGIHAMNFSHFSTVRAIQKH